MQSPEALADEVDGHIEELLAAGQADLVALAEEAGVAEDQLGRQGAAAQQLAGTVEIGEDQVEQLGTLDDAELDAGPFVAGEQHREGSSAQGAAAGAGAPRGTVRAVDVVGDAVVDRAGGGPRSDGRAARRGPGCR